MAPWRALIIEFVASVHLREPVQLKLISSYKFTYADAYACTERYYIVSRSGNTVIFTSSLIYFFIYFYFLKIHYHGTLYYMYYRTRYSTFLKFQSAMIHSHLEQSRFHMIQGRNDYMK